MKSSPMPPRAAYMQRGGPLARTGYCRSGPLAWSPAAAVAVTGFSRAVKRQARLREAGCCAACGIWLGDHGGQVQHRCARGMGGTTCPVIDSIVNAVLLCGTAQSGCHGLCERRNQRMHAAGFWLIRGGLIRGGLIRGGQDPAAEPVLLHTAGRKWLLPDGSYGDEGPRRAA